MKYYIIAGEASGDLHASNLIKEIKVLDSQAAFDCWGGDKMKEAGGNLVKHYKDLAFMGFAEVVMNLRTIIRNISFCKKDILEKRPDVIILVDYPGFNLRIAKFAREQGFKVIYYISPQIWAWKKSRVFDIKRDVDKMLVILPFEKEFYAKYGVEVDFVGHPLLDALKDVKGESKPEKPVIALLPGSRKQEISRILPLMVSAVSSFKEYDIRVAVAPSIEENYYREMIKDTRAGIWRGGTYPLLSISTAALVTSGTATLETALMKVPQVVCYKGNILSFWIAKKLVDIKYISLVNLITDKLVVKELIQNELTVSNLKKELEKLLQPDNRKVILSDYNDLAERLGGTGASAKAAQRIYNLLNL
jgi:lipid-A-disaccharide synthase